MEVVGRYSKQPRPPDLGHITTCFGPVSSPSTIHNVRRRLGAEVISQLVHDYQAGVPTTELTVTLRNKALDAFNEIMRMQG